MNSQTLLLPQQLAAMSSSKTIGQSTIFVLWSLKSKIFLAIFRKQNKLVFYRVCSMCPMQPMRHAIKGRESVFYFNTLKLDETLSETVTCLL